MAIRKHFSTFWIEAPVQNLLGLREIGGSSVYDILSLHKAALKPLLFIESVFKYLSFSTRFS